MVNKRIFCKTLGWIKVADEGDTDWHTVLGAAAFLAQEDIEIVGVYICAHMCSMNQNDNVTTLYGEISQHGNLSQDGAILYVQSVSAWNTAPAFGYYFPGEHTIMFPEGRTIPIKEEGVVYLHAHYQGVVTGTTSLSIHAHIFYTKKGQ